MESPSLGLLSFYLTQNLTVFQKPILLLVLIHAIISLHNITSSTHLICDTSDTHGTVGTSTFLNLENAGERNDTSYLENV